MSLRASADDQRDNVNVTPQSETLRVEEMEKLVAKFTWGTTEIRPNSKIILYMNHSHDGIVLPIQEYTVMGRKDATSQHSLDLDLTPFGAAENGVSRTHASIHINNNVASIIDMGSSNGTYLNGQRLDPNTPRILRDGDEIYLSKMIMHIYFANEAT